MFRTLLAFPRSGLEIALLLTAYVLAALMGLGIIAIGARWLVAPRAAAADYGIPVAEGAAGAGPYPAIKGVRDIATGLVGLALLIAGTADTLGWFMLAAATVPAGDMLIVRRHHGPKTAAYGIHGTTAAVMVAVAVMLLLG